MGWIRYLFPGARVQFAAVVVDLEQVPVLGLRVEQCVAYDLRVWVNNGFARGKVRYARRERDYAHYRSHNERALGRSGAGRGGGGSLRDRAGHLCQVHGRWSVPVADLVDKKEMLAPAGGARVRRGRARAGDAACRQSHRPKCGPTELLRAVSLRPRPHPLQAPRRPPPSSLQRQPLGPMHRRTPRPLRCVPLTSATATAAAVVADAEAAACAELSATAPLLRGKASISLRGKFSQLTIGCSKSLSSTLPTHRLCAQSRSQRSPKKY